MAKANYYDPSAYTNTFSQQQAQANNPFQDTPDMADNAYSPVSANNPYHDTAYGSVAPDPNNNYYPGWIPSPGYGPNAPAGWHDPNGNLKPVPNPTNAPIKPNPPGGTNQTQYNGSKDVKSLVDYYQKSNPINLEGLITFLNSNGIQAKRATRAGGANSDDKIIVDGKTYDLIRDVGGAGASWQFIDESMGGGDSQGGQMQMAPPQSPMVMGDGTIPPGIPYSPTPAPQMNPNANGVLNDILTKPVYDQNYLNQLNETQKEMALKRNEQLGSGLLQNAASRGTTNGGQLVRRQSELSNDLTNQLLQSNRDVNIQTTGANRAGLLDALTSASSMYRDNLAGAQFTDDQSLRATQQRRADQELARLLEQYNRDNTYRYDSMNNNNQNSLINTILGR